MNKVLLKVEMSYVLWNSWIHYRLYISPPLVHLLSSMKAVDALPVFFCKISFNFILLPTPCLYGLVVLECISNLYSVKLMDLSG